MVFCHRRITTTKNRSSRSVVIRGHATGEDERAYSTGKRGSDRTLSDASTFISAEHFATKQLQDVVLS